MKKANRFLLFLFTIALAFGTINLFAISENIDSESAPEPLFVSLFALFYVVTSWLPSHKKSGERILRNMTGTLFVMVVTFALADIIYDFSAVNWFFVFKLAFAIFTYYTLGRHFANNPKDLEVCLLIFAITCTFVIVSSFTFLSDIVSFSKGRMSIYGENPNSTSSRMSVAIFAFMYFFNKKDVRWVYKIGMLGCIVLLLVYIIMSGSRGSFLFTLGGIALFVLLTGKRKGRTVIAAVFGLLLVEYSVNHYLDMEEVSMFDRLSELGESGDSRSQLMKYALQIYEDYPIIGVGSNGYLSEKLLRGMDGRDSHNIITTIMAMGGTVALICFLKFLYINLSILIKRIQQKLLPLVMFLSMFFISMKTGGVITFMLMWYVYAIAYGMSRPQFINMDPSCSLLSRKNAKHNG